MLLFYGHRRMPFLLEYDLKDIGLIRTEKVYAKVTDKDGDFTRVTESPKKVGRGTEQRLASFEVQGKANDAVDRKSVV